MARGSIFRSRARRLIALALLTLVIALPLAVAARHARAAWLPAVASGHGGGTLAIESNRIRRLFPGAKRTLTLSLHNHDSKHALAVRGVRVRVTGTTKRRCIAARRNLRISQPKVTTLTIRPGGFRTVRALLTMPTSVANACQGATFKLKYTAQVRRRGQR